MVNTNDAARASEKRPTAGERPPAGERPTVSIILGTYNSSRYVEAALQSALDQTVRDIEIIAVDDCSKDNTFELVQAMAEKDARLKPIRLEANAGPGGARHQAVLRATGEWVAVMDDDDILHADRLERLLDAAERGGFDVVADNLRYVREDGVEEIGPAVEPTDSTAIWTVGFAEFVLANLPGETGFKLGFLKPMMRRSFMVEHGVNYHRELRVVEDYQFIFDLLSAGGKFGFLNEPLYDYRIRTTSGSHNYSEALLVQIAQVARENLDDPGVRNDPVVHAAAARRLKYAINNAAYVRLRQAIRKRDPGALTGTVVRHLPSLPYMVWRIVRVPFTGRVWTSGAKVLAPTDLGMKRWTETATAAE